MEKIIHPQTNSDSFFFLYVLSVAAWNKVTNLTCVQVYFFYFCILRHHIYIFLNNNSNGCCLKMWNEKWNMRTSHNRNIAVRRRRKSFLRLDSRKGGGRKKICWGSNCTCACPLLRLPVSIEDEAGVAICWPDGGCASAASSYWPPMLILKCFCLTPPVCADPVRPGSEVHQAAAAHFH